MRVTVISEIEIELTVLTAELTLTLNVEVEGIIFARGMLNLTLSLVGVAFSITELTYTGLGGYTLFETLTALKELTSPPDGVFKGFACGLV